MLMPLLPSLVLSSSIWFNTVPANCAKIPNPNAPAALANDNRVPAGTLKDGVLTVRLIATPAAWQPEGKDGCGLRVHAFKEEGKSAQIPGPLIRVRAGTEIRVIIRNDLGAPLNMRGLLDRQLGLPERDSRMRIRAAAVVIPPGASHEFTYRATTPGNYYYWGTTPFDTVAAFPNRPPGTPLPLFSPYEDSQLIGALIVDPERGSLPDRVFVLTRWRLASSDTVEAGRIINAVNGRSYPHTEPLSAAVGDTLRWRVLNTSNASHTMHLHGFYFRVVSQGDAVADSTFGRAQQQLAVSEFMLGNRTMTMEWVPERAGNWLFHCHFVAHMSPAQRIARVFGTELATKASDAHHAAHEMAGLVMGIHVKSNDNAIQPTSSPRRRLRLYTSERPRVFGDDPGYSFVLQEGSKAPAMDSVRIPGSSIILHKGEPTQIVVFNRLKFPLAVHWHGIELDSYFDGVPDFSGAPGNIAPPIAPGDSFVVQMTPPRAGTFFYHIHSEQSDELISGLYGSLIVRDPAAPFDAANDRTFVLSAGGRGRTANQTIFVNGTTKPEPIEMVVGQTQRWRFISIPANGSFDVRIVGLENATWRHVARDGAELPAGQAVVRPAQARIAVGTAADFEFTATQAGEYVLQVDLPRGPTAVAGFATNVTIRVK